MLPPTRQLVQVSSVPGAPSSGRVPSLEDWAAHLGQAAGRELSAHLDTYIATPTAEASLPLLEPGLFRAMAERAVQAIVDASRDLMTRMHDEVPSDLRHDVEVARLSPRHAQRGQFHEGVRRDFDDFLTRVATLGTLRDQFRRSQADAEERSNTRAQGAGFAAGLLGGALLGPLGLAIAGAAAGYIAGKTVESELEEKWKAVEAALLSAMEAWDGAVSAAAANTHRLLGDYESRLDEVVAQAARRHAEARARALDEERTRSRVPEFAPVRRDAAPLSRSRLLATLVVAAAAGAALSSYLVLSGESAEARVTSSATPLPVSAPTPAPEVAAPQATGVPAGATTPTGTSPVPLTVLSPGTVLRQGPSESFHSLAMLKNQEPAFVLDTSVPSWTKVRLQDGREGWVLR